MLLKSLFDKIAKPLVQWYLSSPRTYSYRGIDLIVQPGIFHPGLFFSTKFLLEELCKTELKNKSFLELGAGSGLISIHAHKQGAMVTASDISPAAVENLKKNQEKNKSDFRIIHSDLFRDIPLQKFDLIAINPPFYKKDSLIDEDYAWFCGKNMEYFENLFSGLGHYIHDNSSVLMVLSNGCDIEGIKNISGKYQFHMTQIRVKKNLIESLFIYQIKRA